MTTRPSGEPIGFSAVALLLALSSAPAGAQCPNEVVFCPGAAPVLNCPLVSCAGGQCVKWVTETLEYCACDAGDETPPPPSTCHIYIENAGNGVYDIKCSGGSCPGTQTCPTGTAVYVDPQGCKHFTCPCS